MFLSILNWCKRRAIPPGHKSGRANCPGIFQILMNIIRPPTLPSSPPNPPPPKPDIVTMCTQGNLQLIKDNLEHASKEQLSEGMNEAIKWGHQDVVRFFAESSTIPVTEGQLELACRLNRYEIAKIIITAGKKLTPPLSIIKGLRATNSNNIFRMLYEYEQQKTDFVG